MPDAAHGSLFAPFAVLLISCSGPQDALVGEAPAAEPDASPDAASPAPEPAPAPARRSARPYGDSPITAVAETLTDVALAALDGRSVVSLPAPTRHGFAGGVPQVRFNHRDGQERRPAGEPTVIGWFMEATFVLKIGEPNPEASDEANDGRMQVILYLGPGGLRVAGLRLSRMRPRPGLPAPGGFGGLERVGRDLLERLRAGTLQDLVMGDAERQIIADEQLWQEIQRELPRAGVFERAGRFAANVSGLPLTFDLDDVGVLIRDAEGEIFSLAYDFDDVNGQLALDDSPLIRVRPLGR